jgi:hypothetical protein
MHLLTNPSEVPLVARIFKEWQVSTDTTYINNALKKLKTILIQHSLNPTLSPLDPAIEHLDLTPEEKQELLFHVWTYIDNDSILTDIQEEMKKG